MMEIPRCPEAGGIIQDLIIGEPKYFILLCR